MPDTGRKGDDPTESLQYFNLSVLVPCHENGIDVGHVLRDTVPGLQWTSAS